MNIKVAEVVAAKLRDPKFLIMWERKLDKRRASQPRSITGDGMFLVYTLLERNTMLQLYTILHHIRIYYLL